MEATSPNDRTAGRSSVGMRRFTIEFIRGLKVLSRISVEAADFAAAASHPDTVAEKARIGCVRYKVREKK